MKNIVKPLLPAVSACLLTIMVLLLYIFDANYITRKNIDDFKISDDYFCREIETVSEGNFFNNIEGYCFNTEKMYQYYNFGVNMYGKGSYIVLDLCLVKDEDVYILPSVQKRRGELLAVERAENLKETPAYNFFAGVQSKYIGRLLPDGEYRIGIVYYGYEGDNYIIVTDRELVK